MRLQYLKAAHRYQDIPALFHQFDSLLDILRHTQFDTAQQVIDTLKAEVEQHRDGAEPNDDLTMMCIRVD